MDELSAWLDYLFLSVQRYIHRYGFRMVQASGTLNQLYISLDEARGLLKMGQSHGSQGPAQALGLPPIAALEAKLQAQITHLESLTGGPVSQLRARFQLSTAQTALLMAAAAPLLSIDLARLYAFAWADFAVKLPTVGFLIELLGSGPLSSLMSEFQEEAPLVRYRLLNFRDGGPWGTPSPNLHRGVLVPEALLGFLRGELESLPATLEQVAQLSTALEAPPSAQLFINPGLKGELALALRQAIQSGLPRILLIGAEGSGRRSLLSSLAAEMGYGLLTLNLSRLPKEDGAYMEHLADASREALLRQTVLLIRGATLFEDREEWARRSSGFTRIINRYTGPIIFTARFPAANLHRSISKLFELNFPPANSKEQREIWHQALLEDGQVEDLALAEPLARRFSIPPGTIRQSLREARAQRLLLGGALSIIDVAQAVRRRLDHALSQVADPYHTTLSWDDIILPDEVMEVLQEIISHAKHRERVFDDWGFRRKMAYGRGLACLFSGPPGTGKTMMAGILAKELGREIYRVDLSRIVSKWVGETEKNLAQVFDEAEKAQVILLFDEADSLFSSRTEVKGSNDRHANMEINYLLQRMESFDGMSLLTTNFEKSIDEAFKRRIKFKVEFPMPDAEQRALLWQVMIPDRAEVKEGIRFSILGKRYKLSGGNIKNAVLRAAFYAVNEGRPIDHALLNRAAIAESRDMGRLI